MEEGARTLNEVDHHGCGSALEMVSKALRTTILSDTIATKPCRFSLPNFEDLRHRSWTEMIVL